MIDSISNINTFFGFALMIIYVRRYMLHLREPELLKETFYYKTQRHIKNKKLIILMSVCIFVEVFIISIRCLVS